MPSIEDFEKLDLRVGEVVGAEAIPTSDRLLKVTVDLGGERRTMVGGLARSYAPADLLGMQVVVVANLEPATIRGVSSEGMMLGAGCDGPGEVALLTVNRSVPNGTLVR